MSSKFNYINKYYFKERETSKRKKKTKGPKLFAASKTLGYKVRKLPS